MPRYLTSQELLARRRREQLLHLARGENGQLDADRVDQAIAAAEDEVTSYLLSRYGGDLPSDPGGASEQLKRLVADLVPWHLGKGAPALAEAVVDEYKATVSLLRSIASGSASLNLPSKPSSDNASPVIAARRPASDAKLTLETLERW
jgi:phage gp36-like protein